MRQSVRVTSCGWLVGWTLLLAGMVAAQAAEPPAVELAVFDVDATPPLGSAMAYDPVKRLDEMTLRCRGVVLIGEKPLAVLSYYACHPQSYYRTSLRKPNRRWSRSPSLPTLRWIPRASPRSTGAREEGLGNVDYSI